MIKLDIINEVVNRTGITKTKAEMAVETVFESMKRLLPRAIALSCVALACLTFVLERPESDATRAPALKSPFRQAKLYDSNPARNCRRSNKHARSGRSGAEATRSGNDW